MNFIFPHIGNVIIPIDKLICFRGVGSTTNQPVWECSSPLLSDMLPLVLELGSKVAAVDGIQKQRVDAKQSGDLATDTSH